MPTGRSQFERFEALLHWPGIRSDMALDRSTKVQIGAGTASIVVFVALVVMVGTQNGPQGLEPSGGLAMVGVLVAFVIFLAVLGLALSDQLSDD